MSGTNATISRITGTSTLVRPRFEPGMLLQHDDLDQMTSYTRELNRLAKLALECAWLREPSVLVGLDRFPVQRAMQPVHQRENEIEVARLHQLAAVVQSMQLTHVANPPSAIPIRVGHQYFRLNKSGLAWQGLARARNVAAYVPSDFPNPDVQMLVVLPPV